VKKNKTTFTPDKFDEWITFLYHHIHELQTFKNGPVFMAQPIHCLHEYRRIDNVTHIHRGLYSEQ